MIRDREAGGGILLGVAALLVLLTGGWWLVHSPKGLSFTIVFENAGDLKRGDRVWLHGGAVGAVQYVERHVHPASTDVRITVAAEQAGAIRADATAVILNGAKRSLFSRRPVVEIVNSTVQPPYPPVPGDGVLRGMDSPLTLDAWIRQKSREGKREAWVRRVDLLRDGLQEIRDQLDPDQTSPQVREALRQWRVFSDRLRRQGPPAMALYRTWLALKERMRPVLKELSDFGRPDLADRLRWNMRQTDQMLQSWRAIDARSLTGARF